MLTNSQTICLDVYSFALMLLPSLLREEVKKLFRTFGNENFVQISCKCEQDVIDMNSVLLCSSYAIFVDGNETATTSLLVAVQMIFAMHYVFNLAYPKKLESYFKYIQKHIVKLHNNVVPNSKVLKLISKLTN